VQLVDTDDMMDEMSEIVDGPRRTSACRIGAITGLVFVFIGAVLVASKIGVTMESPKTTSSSSPGGIAWHDAIISEDQYYSPQCSQASQKNEDCERKIGYTDCSQWTGKTNGWPATFITNYPDHKRPWTCFFSDRLNWIAKPLQMCNHNYKPVIATSLEDCAKKCMAQEQNKGLYTAKCSEFSYHKTWPAKGECRMGNNKQNGHLGLRCEGKKNHDRCKNNPTDCVLYSMELMR